MRFVKSGLGVMGAIALGCGVAMAQSTGVVLGEKGFADVEILYDHPDFAFLNARPKGSRYQKLFLLHKTDVTQPILVPTDAKSDDKAPVFEAPWLAPLTRSSGFREKACYGARYSNNKQSVGHLSIGWSGKMGRDDAEEPLFSSSLELTNPEACQNGGALKVVITGNTVFHPTAPAELCVYHNLQTGRNEAENRKLSFEESIARCPSSPTFDHGLRDRGIFSAELLDKNDAYDLYRVRVKGQYPYDYAIEHKVAANEPFMPLQKDALGNLRPAQGFIDQLAAQGVSLSVPPNWHSIDTNLLHYVEGVKRPYPNRPELPEMPLHTTRLTLPREGRLTTYNKWSELNIPPFKATDIEHAVLDNGAALPKTNAPVAPTLEEKEVVRQTYLADAKRREQSDEIAFSRTTLARPFALSALYRSAWFTKCENSKDLSCNIGSCEYNLDIAENNKRRYGGELINWIRSPRDDSSKERTFANTFDGCRYLYARSVLNSSPAEQQQFQQHYDRAQLFFRAADMEGYYRRQDNAQAAYNFSLITAYGDRQLDDARYWAKRLEALSGEKDPWLALYEEHYDYWDLSERVGTTRGVPILRDPETNYQRTFVSGGRTFTYEDVIARYPKFSQATSGSPVFPESFPPVYFRDDKLTVHVSYFDYNTRRLVFRQLPYKYVKAAVDRGETPEMLKPLLTHFYQLDWNPRFRTPNDVMTYLGRARAWAETEDYIAEQEAKRLQ